MLQHLRGRRQPIGYKNNIVKHDATQSSGFEKQLCAQICAVVQAWMILLNSPAGGRDTATFLRGVTMQIPSFLTHFRALHATAAMFVVCSSSRGILWPPPPAPALPSQSVYLPRGILRIRMPVRCAIGGYWDAQSNQSPFRLPQQRKNDKRQYHTP